MKKMSRLFIVMILLVSLVTSFAACASKDTKSDNQGSGTAGGTESSQSTAASAEEKKPVTLSLITYELWGNEPGLKAGIAQYEKNTGNKIELQLYPNDQLDSVLKTKLATGDVADVMASHTDRNKFPEDSVEVLDGPWVSKLNSEGIKYLYGRKSDGKIVNAPYGPSEYLAVIYNKKVFESAGIKPPLKTYKDLLEACEKIKAANVTPIALANKEGHIAQIFSLIGAGYLYEQKADIVDKLVTGKAKPKEIPEVVDLFKRIYTLKEKGYINKDYMSMGSIDAGRAVAEGKAGMAFLSDWFINDLKEAMPDKIADTGLMPATFGDDYIDVNKGLQVKGLWLPVASKQKEEAREFINAMLSDEIQKVIFDAQPGPSVLSGIQVKMNVWQEEMAEYEKTMPSNGGWNRLFTAGLGNDYGKKWQDFFAGKPLDAVLDDWYNDYSKVYKAKGMDGWK